MPITDQILEALSTITDELTWLALGWPVAILIIAVALVAGWRPQLRTLGLLITAPVLSVFVVSISFASLFNAATFGLLAVVCTKLTRDRTERIQPGGWQLWTAVALIAFGFVYPHFVDGAWYRSLYASPVGLVPCPTLAVVAGFALLARRSRMRALLAVLAVWTAFYALFGMFRLGVWLDIGLVVAMFALAFDAFRR